MLSTSQTNRNLSTRFLQAIAPGRKGPQWGSSRLSRKLGLWNSNRPTGQHCRKPFSYLWVSLWRRQWPWHDLSPMLFFELVAWGKDIYWASGQAGSGKSTLMRYIFNNSWTHNLLQTQASKKRPVTAGYFLWKARDILQKSQRGLLQSLLYEILNQCQELVPVLCPLQLYRYDIRSKPWALRELFDALQQLK